MLQVCMFSVLFSSIGSHANYSAKSMRNKGGYEVIKKAIEKPGLRHIGQIAASVEGNGLDLLTDTKHLTLMLSNGVLLIVGLPLVFNNEQYAL
ncbi:hypothetical protein NC651_037505 [Populus alba x Populus x berolinensis]|nr:hypothetical protein NC651_037505 [Populus alba x Populus x berolinensis]